MSRLPTVGGDTDAWGTVLNDYLTKSAGVAALASSPSAGATTFDLAVVPPALKIGSFVAIGAYTTQCELREVSNISGQTLTVAATNYAHATGDALIVIQDRITTDLYGLVSDDSDEWAPLQRLVLEATTFGMTISGALGIGSAGSIHNYKIQQPIVFPTGSHVDRMQIESRTGFTPVESTNAMILSCAKVFPFTATASDNVFTSVGTVHDLAPGVNDPVMFNAPYGETLPGGVVAGHLYYVLTTPTTTTFTVSATPGGGTLDVSSDGAGRGWGRAGVGLSRVFWESMRATVTVVDLNGIKICLQQPAWTRNMRVDMQAAATTQGSAIGIQIGGQISYHDNIEANTAANCTGCAIWALGGAGSGIAVRGFNCNGVDSGDTGMVISVGRHSVRDLWTESCGRAGVELDPTAGGSTGIRGVTFDGYWFHNSNGPGLLTTINCSYALNAAMTVAGNGAHLFSDTGRSIDLYAYNGVGTGETDSSLTYMGHTQAFFSTGIVGPVLHGRYSFPVSGAYTVQRTVETVQVDTTGGDRTITLPTASYWYGWHTTIINSGGANNVIIDPTGAQTINGASTLTLVPGESVKVVSDGYNYLILERKLPGTAQTYTPTNVTTDRAYDADTVVIAELADVVGTLIADLQARKIIG